MNGQSGEEYSEDKEEFVPEEEEEGIKPYKTLVESVLPMQVDCVSWHRTLGNVIAIGAYQLDESNSSGRVGRVYLIVLKPNTDVDSQETDPMRFSVVEEVGTSGVLDLKWEPTEENLLCVATSNSVLIFRLDFEGDIPILEKFKEFVFDDKTMALYIEWMTTSKVLIGDSTGSVQIFEFVHSKSLDLTRVDSRKLHEYLVWVVHYNPRFDMIYSGADDGKFFAFYTKDMHESSKHFMKKYDVGVTSITTMKNFVAVGSYDEILRIYKQSISEGKPFLQLKISVNLGGAVWRTFWIPQTSFQSHKDDKASEDDDSLEFLTIGAACARNGIHFAKINVRTWQANIILSCTEHVGPLAYGFDILKEDSDNSFTIASCYFDKHLLHVWSVKKETLGVE